MIFCNSTALKPYVRPALILSLLFIAFCDSAMAAKCLFISSYHRGYEWSDRVEQGLRSVIEGQCELRQFDMDTKRHKSEAYMLKKGLEAKALIESWQPDVVIAADDNAAKYVVQPYFQDSPIPFVFCGINWTTEEYGFPFRNMTGMVEVAPIEPMLEKAITITAGKRAFYIGAETLTEEKNLARFQSIASQLDIELDAQLVSTVTEWLNAYQVAQNYDFVILGSNSGINDWNQEQVSRQLADSSKRLSVTNHGWMMPYAMLGLTKVPEEHGDWSGRTALAILQGAQPLDIPIVANRMWDIWTNETLLAQADIKLPRPLKHKAKRIR